MFGGSKHQNKGKKGKTFKVTRNTKYHKARRHSVKSFVPTPYFGQLSVPRGKLRSTVRLSPRSSPFHSPSPLARSISRSSPFYSPSPLARSLPRSISSLSSANSVVSPFLDSPNTVRTAETIPMTPPVSRFPNRRPSIIRREGEDTSQRMYTSDNLDDIRGIQLSNAWDPQSVKDVDNWIEETNPYRINRHRPPSPPLL